MLDEHGQKHIPPPQAGKLQGFKVPNMVHLLVDLPMHHDMQFTSILHWVFFWSLISCLWIQKKHLMTGDDMVAQAYLLVDLPMYYDKEFTSILHCGIYYLVSHLMLVDSEEAL